EASRPFFTVSGSNRSPKRNGVRWRRCPTLPRTEAEPARSRLPQGVAAGAVRPSPPRRPMRDSMVRLTPHPPAAALALVTLIAVPSAESAPASRATTPAATLRLVPEPMQLELGAGIFALDQRLSIAVPSGDAEDLFAAGLLAAEIRAAGGAD